MISINLMKKITLLLLVIINVSCSQEEQSTNFAKHFPPIGSNIMGKHLTTTYSFVDSINFGIKGQSKIILTKQFTEVGRHHLETENHIIIKLFHKKMGRWTPTDSAIIKSEAEYDLNPIISDYNKDGYNDIVFTSGEAARGANNIQTMVLFNASTHTLTWIKNSEQFANLSYNPALDCVIAWLFHGGVSTAFLHIEHDSLVQFALVEKYDTEINAYEYINGQTRIIAHFIDTNSTFSYFPLFCNFSPIQECE